MQSWENREYIFMLVSFSIEANVNYQSLLYVVYFFVHRVFHAQI